MKHAWLPTMLVGAVLCLSTNSLAQVKTEQLRSNAPQVIEVTARKYVFTPSPIHVKAGTRVELKITALDHAHGFQIERLPEGAAKESTPGLVFSSGPECYKIQKQQTATVEFLPQTAGTYRFKCCVHCGIHHRSMKGELIVDP